MGGWLDAAFELTADICVDVLELAAREAGKTCRHPAAIVPTIHERAAEIIAARDRQRRLATPLQLVEGWQGVPGTWWKPTVEELEAAKRELVERQGRQAGTRGG